MRFHNRTMICRLLTRGTAISALFLLSACIPSLDKPRDSLAIPKAFDEKDQGRSAPDSDWPKLFRAKELEHIVTAVAESNTDLEAAIARMAEAEARAASFRGPLVPGLDFAGAGQRSVTPGTLSSDQAPFTSTESNLFSLGLTASYTLDVWGRLRSLAHASEASAEASRFDYDALAISLKASAAQTYFTALAAKDRIRVHQDNVRLATQILDAIKARMSVGTASALDVAEQESIVATQKATIPPLEQQLVQARVSLAVLNGVRPEGFVLDARGLDGVTVPEIAAGAPSTLLLRRPDLARAEADLRSAEANVEAARMAFLPTFSLTAKNGVTSRNLSTLLRSDATNPALSSSITAPIFDGGTLTADFNLEKGIRDELAANYRKAVLTALSDVEIALSNVKTSSDQERLQYDAVIASRRAYAITEGRLRAGTIDSVTLLNVEQTLFQAEDALITARLARLSAALSLIQALGGGFAVAPSSAVAQRLFTPTPGEMRTTP